MSAPKLHITDQDFEEITRLLEVTKKLESELRRATIVSRADVPNDVVTLDSTVKFVCENTGVEAEVSLVHPSKADLAAKKISILSPLGSALIGLRVGQWFSWSGPKGRLHRIRVTSVGFQPEAAAIWEW